MASILDLRKKYLGAGDATDEDMRIVQAVREYVDKEIMPHRQDLDGGWHRNEELAQKTFEKVHQGLVDIGVQKAICRKEMSIYNCETRTTALERQTGLYYLKSAGCKSR